MALSQQCNKCDGPLFMLKFDDAQVCWQACCAQCGNIYVLLPNGVVELLALRQFAEEGQ